MPRLRTANMAGKLRSGVKRAAEAGTRLDCAGMSEQAASTDTSAARGAERCRAARGARAPGPGDPAAARHPDPQGRRAGRRQGPAGRARRPLARGSPAWRRAPKRRCPASAAWSEPPCACSSASTGPDLGRAALLDPHAGLRDRPRRAAQDAALGAAAELRRLGAVPGRRRLPGSRTCARSSPPRAPATRRIRVARREVNGGIVAASNDALAMARGEFVALLDHDDELHPDALAHVAEAIDRHARGRLRLHRRGQDRPARPPLEPLLQARLVAGAAADADVHLPPQRPAPLAGRGGRRLRPRVRGLPGLGPGAEGDRARPRRSSTCPACSTTGACSRPPPPRPRRPSRGPSKPAGAPCRRTASAPGSRRRSRWTRPTRASCTSTRSCASSRWSAS